jgi:hypothetical protein
MLGDVDVPPEAVEALVSLADPETFKLSNL